MNKLVWRNIGRFALLLGIQLLVLNYVYLGSYTMPMLYVLFLLMLPTSMPRIPLLLICFATGLCIDFTTGVLGFHAMACTVVGMTRILFADRILTRGEPIIVKQPSIRSVTPQYFIAYLILMLVIFYAVLFLAELFGSRGFGDMLLSVLCSTLTTALLAILYQIIFIRKEAK